MKPAFLMPVKFFPMLIASTIFVVLCTAVQAQTPQAAQTSNPDLLFNDKPLEPIAVGRMSSGNASRKNPIDLKLYTPELQGIVIQENLNKPKENKIGYSFKYKAYDLETQNPSYDVYKVLADLGNHTYLMLIESSGGGSGAFTSLLLMKRNGDFIQNIQEITGGDRANGGIVSASYKDGLMTVVQYVTPFSAFADALALTDPKNPILQMDNPENNLIDGANCRAGEVTSQGKIGEKLNPISLTFYAESPCDGGNAKPGTLQAFYEQSVNNYRQSGKTTLDNKGMTNFAKEILDAFKARPH